MIAAEAVSLGYGPRVVVAGVDLAAGPGEVVGLIGPNGSGKTTLLRALYAVLKPLSGAVLVDGAPLRELSAQQTARTMAVVVQESTGDLPLTVAEMVLLGRVPHLPVFGRPRAHDYQVAARALRRVGARGLAERPFAGLSGGEKQRVLIARALAQEAEHLLLDEPTNHLDIRYQHEVLQLVRSLGVTTVVVLHDLNLAGRYCDRLVLLHEGRVAAAGTTDEVLRPEVLEPVYGIGVRRVVADGRVQLLFQPHPLPAEPVEHVPAVHDAEVYSAEIHAAEVHAAGSA